MATTMREDIQDVLELAQQGRLSLIEALGIIRHRMNLSYTDLEQQSAAWGIPLARMTFSYALAGRAGGRPQEPSTDVLTALLLIYGLDLADFGIDPEAPGYRLVTNALRGYRLTGPPTDPRREGRRNQRKDTLVTTCETPRRDFTLMPVGLAALRAA